MDTTMRIHRLLPCRGVARMKPGPEVIKIISCSIQLSMKFILLIYVKRQTFVGILTFMSKKNSIISLSEPEKS